MLQYRNKLPHMTHMVSQIKLRFLLNGFFFSNLLNVYKAHHFSLPRILRTLGASHVETKRAVFEDLTWTIIFHDVRFTDSQIQYKQSRHKQKTTSL
jgi:hypothetical protein